MIRITSAEAKAVALCSDPADVVQIFRRGQFTEFLGLSIGDAEMRADGGEAAMRALRRIGQLLNDGRVAV